MDKLLIYYNTLADNRKGRENAKAIEALFPQGEFTYADITAISDIYSAIKDAPEDNRVVIAGGDGTLNRLVNAIGNRELNRELYYFACGSGNDFLADIGKKRDELVLLNPYIENLPTVIVNDKEYRFLNGIGYGIDGYCCEVGDELRVKSDKPINYTSIAIKGLMFFYKPTNARVTVDGAVHTYKRVWLSPIMNGRYYGGGMMVTPNQNRLNKERTQSVAVMYGSRKLKTLVVFPSIFKGEHIKHTEMVEVMTGHDITVELDRPTALQIDGETIKGVTSCRVISRLPETSKAVGAETE